MKNTFCMMAAAAVLVISGTQSTAQAEDGFVPIFNGKDLKGWKSNDETPGAFVVEDGLLKVHKGKAHLFYLGEDGKANFKNFELKARVKTMPGANGGIYFHTQFQETGWPDKGFECQVNSTHKDPKKTGSLYGVVNVLVLQPGQQPPPGSLENKIRDKAPSTDGEWFDYHIVVKDKTITLKVNGETTVEWTEPEGFDPATALKGMPGRKLGSGTIGLQSHDPDSVTYYEKILLKITD